MPDDYGNGLCFSLGQEFVGICIFDEDISSIVRGDDDGELFVTSRVSGGGCGVRVSVAATRH
jgi:hypothetical protein